jgi:hypothetical protein
MLCMKGTAAEGAEEVARPVERRTSKTKEV